MIIAITYLPFVVFSAFSCTFEGNAAKFFKILSLIFATVALFFYILFIKNLINWFKSNSKNFDWYQINILTQILM